MGIIVNKNDDQNDELSRRINADLRAKLGGNTGLIHDEDDVDFVDDSEYIEDFKKTGKFGWVWVILIALAILAAILIVFF